MLKFADLIYPLSEDEFFSEYLGKKCFVSKCNNEYRKQYFENIVTWDKITEYLNNDRAVSGLQLIDQNHRKHCMEQGELEGPNENIPHWCRDTYYDRKLVWKRWHNGESMILTKASNLTKNMSAIANSIETAYNRHYERPCATDAHLYCSASADSKSFHCHADSTENFLIHAIGSVHWKVYPVISAKGGKLPDEEKKRHKPTIDQVLTVGDVLYVPKRMCHEAIAVGERVSISFPTLVQGKRRALDRNYYDFRPGTYNE